MQADANAPFEYTTYRPSESLYVLDLTGVSAGDPAGARVVASDLVKSYRLITYASGEKPVVRLEILLAKGIEPKLERKGTQDLTLLVARDAVAAKAPAAPAEGFAGTPASAKSADPSANVSSLRSVRFICSRMATATEVSITVRRR